jgi:hypothetical protein
MFGASVNNLSWADIASVNNLFHYLIGCSAVGGGSANTGFIFRN